MELTVVIVFLVGLGLFVVPGLQRASQKAKRITCLNHFMQIGSAYRVWENDHGGRYPTDAPQTNGGWSDLLSRTNVTTCLWMNYVKMSNELGQNPSILVCPADERKPADHFNNIVGNTNLSYFIGVNADDTLPQSLLGGDRNLGPGTTPDVQYGFSPADGRGNDVIINGPVCWSLKMHSHGNRAGCGNIMLGDGSVQQATSEGLNEDWLKAARATATSSAGMRFIFP